MVVWFAGVVLFPGTVPAVADSPQALARSAEASPVTKSAGEVQALIAKTNAILKIDVPSAAGLCERRATTPIKSMLGTD
jgi:hypothetical protein